MARDWDLDKDATLDAESKKTMLSSGRELVAYVRRMHEDGNVPAGKYTLPPSHMEALVVMLAERCDILQAAQVNQNRQIAWLTAALQYNVTTGHSVFDTEEVNRLRDAFLKEEDPAQKTTVSEPKDSS
jgi:hypothetical protein